MCQHRYYRGYILGEKLPPGIALISGRLTHETIEENMLHKIDCGELLPLEQIKDLARDKTVAVFDTEEIALDEKEEKAGKDAIKSQTIDMVVNLSEAHHKELAPIIEPVAVERAWVVELDGFPYDLGGRIDLMEKSGIRDTKTRKGPASASSDTIATLTGLSQSMLQLTMYSLAIKTLDNVVPKLKVDYLIKTKRPYSVTIETERSEKDYDRLLRIIEVFCRGTEAEVWGPCDPGHWACSPKWCGYYGRTCEYR